MFLCGEENGKKNRKPSWRDKSQANGARENRKQGYGPLHI
jgi:hypothetical protein